jgi:hypothetical protein
LPLTGAWRGNAKRCHADGKAAPFGAAVGKKEEVMKKSKKRTVRKVDDSQIAAMAREAAVAGDGAMVKICGRALAGNAKARTECARVIFAARAMQD